MAMDVQWQNPQSAEHRIESCDSRHCKERHRTWTKMPVQAAAETWVSENGVIYRNIPGLIPSPKKLNPPQILKTRLHLQFWKIGGQFDF